MDSRKDNSESDLNNLPAEIKWRILSFLSSKRDQANFSKTSSNLQAISNDFWPAQFKASFPYALQYYNFDNQEEVAKINWHQEHNRWERWENIILNYNGTGSDIYNIPRYAIHLEMPLPIVKMHLPLHDDENFDFNEFIQLFSVNFYKISDINYLFYSCFALDVSLEEMTKKIIWDAIDYRPDTSKLEILLDPACYVSSEIKAMIAKPENISWLIYILNINHLETAELLLANGCDPNQPEQDRSSYFREKTPLYFCIFTNKIEAAKLLLNYGAQMGDQGNQLLSKAIGTDKVECVNFVLSLNVDVNGSYQGTSPLLSAIREGELPIVETLLEHGANPNELVVGESLIDIAAKHRRHDIVQALLIAKTNLYIQKTEERPESDKSHRIKFNLFGKKVDVEVGSTTGEKINDAKILLAALQGDVEAMQVLDTLGSVKKGELGVIYKQAKRNGLLDQVKSIAQKGMTKSQ